MTGTRYLILLGVMLALATIFPTITSCDDGGEFPDADADADADADGDGDGNGEADGDGDVDADGDGDGDGDIDIDIEPDVWVGLCVDGFPDDSIEGFDDCDDLECLDSPGCCREVADVLVEGDFSRCDALSGCGWTRFPTATEAVDLEAAWLVLSATSRGEAGAFTAPITDFHGEPRLIFAAHIEEASCNEEVGCQQVVGVAYTEQDQLSGGTGVHPSAGIVLDGEREEVHFVVAGAIWASAPLSLEELTTPRGYALGIGPEGEVEFWYGLEMSAPDSSVPLAPAGRADYRSPRGLIDVGVPQRVVGFGALSGEGRGRIGGVTVESPVCDVPDGFELKSDTPLFGLPEGATHVGHPSVIRLPGDQGLLMVHEVDDGLGISRSPDGLNWSFSRRLELPSHLEYGEVAARSPTVVYAGSGVYHLWFEGESQHLGALYDGEPRFAVVHLVSTDGLTWWAPSADGVVLAGEGGESRWLEIRQPSVTMLENRHLLMAFVGQTTESNVDILGTATSLDGEFWSTDSGFSFASETPMAFERDGATSPMILRRGNTLHLWYTGINGSRTTIGYAVAELNAAQRVLRRYGEVFSASSPWHFQRVLAPTVMVLPHDLEAPDLDASTAVLHLWYEGGPPGRGRIGLATREIPATWVPFYNYY